jgi:hypothetical protein
MRRHWTASEIEAVKCLYPYTRTADIAAKIGRSEGQIYQKAADLGLKKSASYLAGPVACRLRRGGNVGKDFRFKPGHQTWNKGLNFDSGGRSVETRFKKGTVPPNYRPVGSTRISVDGYTEIKVAEGMHQWRLLHREVWKEVHGEYPPKNMALVFRDGNKQNCSIENLELLTRQQLMARNTVHNLPEEIKDVIRLNGVLRRKINGK